MDHPPSADRLIERLMDIYGVNRDDVSVVFAPYRICPLGAHIDHQLGNVTAMALDRGTWLAFAPLRAGSPHAQHRLRGRGALCI